MSKKLAFVTGHTKPAAMLSFEKTTKEQYLTGPTETRPCLTFFHHNASEVDIAVKVKDKKPSMLIFDGVPEQRIHSIKKAVQKKLNGSSPEMLQIGTTASVSGVRYVLSHENVLELIQN